jgi:hypothetical protein
VFSWSILQQTIWLIWIWLDGNNEYSHKATKVRWPIFVVITRKSEVEINTTVFSLALLLRTDLLLKLQSSMHSLCLWLIKHALMKKISAKTADDYDWGVFRMKRRSSITPERRHREYATVPNSTDNHVQTLLWPCLYVACPYNYKLMSLLTTIFAL